MAIAPKFCKLCQHYFGQRLGLSRQLAFSFSNAASPSPLYMLMAGVWSVDCLRHGYSGRHTSTLDDPATDLGLAEGKVERLATNCFFVSAVGTSA